MNGLNPQTQSILGAAKADAMAALQAMMQAAQRYEAADTGTLRPPHQNQKYFSSLNPVLQTWQSPKGVVCHYGEPQNDGLIFLLIGLSCQAWIYFFLLGKANVADALRAIEANQQQIDAAIFTAQSGFLSPLDNESYEVSLENLKGFGENMNQALNNLSKVVYAGGDLSQPSKAIADCATDLISLGESLAGSLNGTFLPPSTFLVSRDTLYLHQP